MNPTTHTIGEGTRIMHFFLDTLIVCFLSYFIYQWYNFNVYNWGYTPYRYGYFFFATIFAYTFLMELVFCQTIAKMLTKTKVVSEDGKRPNPFQFFSRALFRTTLITMFGMAWNDKPLHDTFSKTHLVTSRK